MSRIGTKPIPVPEGVKVTIERTRVTAEGPHGRTSAPVPPPITVKEAEDGRTLLVDRPSDNRQHRALHGLTRSLVYNAVTGVAKPFRKILDIVGVGYNAKLAEGRLTLQIGFCHPVHIDVPPDLTLTTPSPQRIIIEGCDKHAVGQFAANVRKIRPPEPYNGKGIRYHDERVLRKAGKSFVSGDK